MPHELKLLPVIRSVYDVATDSAKWPGFLKELARCFSADGAHIVRVHPHEHVLSFSALYGYDEALLRLYGDGSPDMAEVLRRFEQHFSTLMPTDPRVRILEQYPGRPLSCRLAIPEAELHSSKVYKDMLQPANVEYSLVVSLAEDDSSLIMLGVFRGRQSTSFNEQDVELFGELIPYLKQAISLSEHLARADFSKRLALNALDSLSVGILIVEQSARLVHANSVAQRIVDMSDGLANYGGTVKLNAPDADAALRRAVQCAIANARAGTISPGEAIAIPRPSGREPFPLVVGTLWSNHLRYGLGQLDRPLAVLFVTDPEEPLEAPPELLRRLFGLTLAEARVCEGVVHGRTPEEIASWLHVSVGTVRVHLKSIFTKVGVSRQAELVAKILATPVWARHKGHTRTLL